jgi:hypothetical protein
VHIALGSGAREPAILRAESYRAGAFVDVPLAQESTLTAPVKKAARKVKALAAPAVETVEVIEQPVATSRK